MNKLKLVKTRKEHMCQKCGKLINIGESAYRVNLKFLKPIYRCKKCGLSQNEVNNIAANEAYKYYSLTTEEEIIIE